MKATRLFATGVLWVALAVAGFLVGRAAIFESPRPHLITVGPKACDLTPGEEKARISKEKDHRITWQSNAEQPLSIEFEIAKFPPRPKENAHSRT